MNNHQLAVKNFAAERIGKCILRFDFVSHLVRLADRWVYAFDQEFVRYRVNNLTYLLVKSSLNTQILISLPQRLGCPADLSYYLVHMHVDWVVVNKV
jgi:hypothetical protein